MKYAYYCDSPLKNGYWRKSSAQLDFYGEWKLCESDCVSFQEYNEIERINSSLNRSEIKRRNSKSMINCLRS